MTTLKLYQQGATDNTLDIFRYVAGQLKQVDKGTERRAIVSHNGGVLLMAPTGSGKTMIAGEVVGRLSRDEKVVWFWFAPFKGLVAQTESSLREEFPTLRVRNLKADRQVMGTKPGDVWVSTWQAVAARDTDARKIRSSSEDNLSLDALLVRLRENGFFIGVIVDESHHGFGHGTQALDYYTQHLSPDFTMLLTATPDDADAEAFKKAAGFQRLHPVTISRDDAVSEGLVKPAVRSIVFVADKGQELLVDYETTALREGTLIHRAVKAGLKNEGVDLVPLMLVQVDSSKDSVERVKGKLLDVGFTEDQIAIHTAAEPDSNLLALAVDETKEVLIFKMAVALGFDAPRAFTLVSMRGIVDADFGTQIVGRIMRVHRRCQGVELPPFLQNAYVLLADRESQMGLETAAQKINNIKTQLAKVSPYAVVVQVAGENQLQIVKNGQTYLLPGDKQLPKEIDWTSPERSSLRLNEVPTPTQPFWLEVLGEPTERQSGGTATARPAVGQFVYNLRADVPKTFLTQRMIVGVDESGMAGGIVENFQLTEAILMDGMRLAVDVTKIEQSVFSGDDETHTLVEADVAVKETEILAQRMLFNMGTVDPRALQEGLLQRLRNAYRELNLAIADNEEQLEYALALIMVQHPHLLKEARKACQAKYTEVVPTASLPEEMVSDTPLNKSLRNIYRVYPPDLNTWERPFAEWLDTRDDKSILWWHRNLPHKPWSVAVTLANGSQFFPDFVVAVPERKTPDSILLVDTKRAINDDANSLVKAVTDHKSYGRTAIIFYEQEKRWCLVRYNEEKDKNEVAEPFDLNAAKTSEEV